MGWFSNSRFAFCRGVANHAWHFPPELSHEGKLTALTLTCDHCGAKRKDRVAFATGAVETRSYAYADGYLLDLQGEKRPEKAELRRDGLALLVGDAKADTRHSKVRRLRPRRTRAA